MQALIKVPSLLKSVFALTALWLANGALAAGVEWQVHELPKEQRRYGYRYMVYLPPGYAEQQREWPLVLSLHGRGEWGDNLQLVRSRGLARHLSRGNALQAVVVAPQSPQGQMWHPLFLDAVMRDVAARYQFDRQRVYLTGLSMGGIGSWNMAMAWPGRFAAVAPIAGSLMNDIAADQMGMDPPPAEQLLPFLRRLQHLPVWVFHGDRDTLVDTLLGKRSAELFEKAGGKPRMTIYPMTDHDSWTPTYSENPDFYPWLLAQKNPDARWDEARPTIRPELYVGNYVDGDGTLRAVVRAEQGVLNVRWLTENNEEELVVLDEDRFLGIGMVQFGGRSADGHRLTLAWIGMPELRWQPQP